MRRVNTPVLSEFDRISLELGFKFGASHRFRNRCHVVPLKAYGRSSKDVGLITGMRNVSVNAWVKRFKQEGIPGLQTKPGQGRKPVLDTEDKEGLLAAIKSAVNAYTRAMPNGKQAGENTSTTASYAVF